jgi:oligopeptide/dipeptide ABC transporter ATP-binding protein
MRQRVMIAIAIACNPKLLIADEPTTALDVSVQYQILQLLKRLRDEHGTSVIFVTHDLGVVADIADRVLVMYAGEVIESGSKEEIFHSPQHPYTISLLAAMPSMEQQRLRRLPSIPGSPPLTGTETGACSFLGRCRWSVAQCGSGHPELAHRLAPPNADHLDRCLLPLEAKDSVRAELQLSGGVR